jgi:hypothetical protein
MTMAVKVMKTRSDAVSKEDGFGDLMEQSASDFTSPAVGPASSFDE